MRIAQGDLSGRMEYSLLRPETTIDDVTRGVRRAIEDGAAAVRTAGVYTPRVKRMIAGRRPVIVAAAAYPFGASKATIKAIEATGAIKDGADEVDVVGHLPNYLAGDLDAARAELLEIVRAARACRRDVKVNVVLDIAMLLRAPDAERLIESACRAVREGACDGIVFDGDSSSSVAMVKRYAFELTMKITLDQPPYADGASVLLQAGVDRISIDVGSLPSV